LFLVVGFIRRQHDGKNVSATGGSLDIIDPAIK
jgi:hypothetical protein